MNKTEIDYVNTHDDARDLIESCSPGCKVEFLRVRNHGDSAREYRITAFRQGRQPLSMCEIYTLPFNADTMSVYLKDRLSKQFDR